MVYQWPVSTNSQLPKEHWMTTSTPKLRKPYWTLRNTKIQGRIQTQRKNATSELFEHPLNSLWWLIRLSVINKLNWASSILAPFCCSTIFQCLMTSWTTMRPTASLLTVQRSWPSFSNSVWCLRQNVKIMILHPQLKVINSVAAQRLTCEHLGTWSSCIGSLYTDSTLHSRVLQ